MSKYANKRTDFNKVSTYKDTIFMDDGAYHFFIDNSEYEHGSYDSKIFEVVTIILEEFFGQEPTVMLYSGNIGAKCYIYQKDFVPLWP